MCLTCSLLYFFFFKQKTAYEMRISDWSSDVCSSDLGARQIIGRDLTKRWQSIRTKLFDEFASDLDCCEPVDLLVRQPLPAFRKICDIADGSHARRREVEQVDDGDDIRARFTGDEDVCRAEIAVRASKPVQGFDRLRDLVDDRGRIDGIDDVELGQRSEEHTSELQSLMRI